MDKRALSQPERMRSSVVWEMFVGYLYGEPGTLKSFLNQLKSPSSRYAALAADPSWVRRLTRNVKAQKIEEIDLMFKAPLSDEELAQQSEREKKLAERNKDTESPVKFWWAEFETIVGVGRDIDSDPKATVFFDFLLSLENRKFDVEETMMWMLCAYFYFPHAVETPEKISNGECRPIDFVPLDCWVPKAKDGELCTTRYQVMNHLCKNHFPKETDNRNNSHLRGGAEWISTETIKAGKPFRPLSTKLAILALKNSQKYKAENGEVFGDNQYWYWLKIAGLFEWVQRDMLRKGGKAEHIAESFGRLPAVAIHFFDELAMFEKYFWDAEEKAQQDGEPIEFVLGLRYEKGKVIPQSNKQAFYWYLKAAEKGHVESQTTVSERYALGIGVKPNLELAFIWLKKAAEKGGARAQCMLGESYFRGEGIQSDLGLAAHWMKQSAQQGYKEAQYFLGKQYLMGEGVGKNPRQAASWFIKAAEQGHDKSQFQLGIQLAHGYGVNLDNKKAYEWVRKAAEQDYRDAQFILGLMYEKGGHPQKDSQQSIEWVRKAAEQELPEAQHYLGDLYARGYILDQDIVQAKSWHKRAADQGYQHT